MVGKTGQEETACHHRFSVINYENKEKIYYES